MLGYWFLLQLFSALPATGGTSGGVAFWAHVGGFLSGILSVKLLCRKDRLADAVRQRKAMSKLVERIR
jgi:membrane associated rhomboid family serine protease